MSQIFETKDVHEPSIVSRHYIMIQSKKSVQNQLPRCATLEMQNGVLILLSIGIWQKKIFRNNILKLEKYANLVFRLRNLP